MILICNSQSRIHPKLRQRLLKIRYDPPNKQNDISDIFTAITRGDLRQTPKRNEIEHRLWKYIHCHPSEIPTIIHDDNIDYQGILSEIMLLSDMFGMLDSSLVKRINLIYPLMVDGTILHKEMDYQLIGLIKEFI